MKRFCESVVSLLVVTLIVGCVPVRAELPPVSDIEVYAQTHSQEETIAYLNSVIQQSLEEALNEPDQNAFATMFPALEGMYENDQQTCRKYKQEVCRNNYNAEAFNAAAVAIIAAGACTAVSAGTAFVICIATAYAAYLLMVQAARERRSGCNTNAIWECQLLTERPQESETP